MWHIFWRGYSRLRSGREHWAWMVVVEVRQGTLGGDTRGWGPAGNTGRGWSWLRSGREHWAGMVVVEVRQGTLGVDGRGWGPTENTVRRGSRLSRRRRRGEEERRGEERRRGGEEEQATDIKSNNPHLAGGEKGSWHSQLILFSRLIVHNILQQCIHDRLAVLNGSWRTKPLPCASQGQEWCLSTMLGRNQPKRKYTIYTIHAMLVEATHLTSSKRGQGTHARAGCPSCPGAKGQGSPKEIFASLPGWTQDWELGNLSLSLPPPSLPPSLSLSNQSNLSPTIQFFCWLWPCWPCINEHVQNDALWLYSLKIW